MTTLPPIAIAIIALWVLDWAACSAIAIWAVKHDNSWLAWDIEDQLPEIILVLFFAWPVFFWKILQTKLKR